MRRLVLTVALMLAGSSAMASSIDHIRGDRTSNGSVISVACTHCPPVEPQTNKAATKPLLTPGTQQISITDVGGKKQISRTEAWLGGSPVTYISHNPAWLPQEGVGTTLAENGNGVDPVATNATVNADLEANATTPKPVSDDGSVLPIDLPLRR